jgi:hypothetical protein
MRRPSVCSVEHKKIRQVRGGGTASAHLVVLRRWYVTLDFGGEKRSLAVSAKTMKWLTSKDNP